MPFVPHVDSGTPHDKITRELQDHGAVIVEGFLDDDTLARFNAELDPLLEATSPKRSFVNPAVEFFFGDKTRHLTGMAAQSRVFAEEILSHPISMGVCDAVLGPFCASYQLNIAHVLDRGPGAEQQILHRDELVWVHLPRPHPEIQVASIVALVDFEAEIGATLLVPGSHEWPTEREAQPDEIAVAKMPAGSAVLYLGSTIHAGGPNSTKDNWRRGMHISYTVGWLRTEENQCLVAPPDIARTLPRRSQELLGYAAHDALMLGGGYLGTVDLVAPADLLADGRL
ncbi:MAG: phytanoyl-CoA dioxygenase family protein [Deltaproteobacteria bacterium]|nr:phytanoyl-CoA dioxygenase family protein [Deltaproteobacteria bacterium]